MPKKIAESKSVAYFTPPLVDEAGFYTVEEAEEKVATSVGEFSVSVHTPTDRVYVDDRQDVAAEERLNGFFDAPFAAEDGDQ